MDAAAITSEPPIAADPANEAMVWAPNLGAILSIPVTVQVVLGSTSLPVAGLMKLARGASFRWISVSAIRSMSSSTAQ